jgi:uncharacterized protein DUF6542
VTGEGDARPAWWAQPAAAGVPPTAPAGPAGPVVPESAATATPPPLDSPRATATAMPPARVVPSARTRKPPPFGDQRGLTALGATIVVGILGGIGAAFDQGTTAGFGVLFALVFSVAAAIGAGSVHREDLVASVALVPFIYVVIAVIASGHDSTLGQNGTMLDAAQEIFISAPAMIFAVGSAAVVAITRAVADRGRGPKRIVTYR